MKPTDGTVSEVNFYKKKRRKKKKKLLYKNYTFDLLSSFSPDPVCWYAYQVTVGSGYPVALHHRLTVSPNMLYMEDSLCFGIDADSFFQ